MKKSVPHDHHLLSLGKPRDANRCPQDEFFYPTLTLMMYSYSLSIFEITSRLKVDTDNRYLYKLHVLTSILAGN